MALVFNGTNIIVLRRKWQPTPVFFFFPPFIFISWRLITSQHFSGFCHTLTWISHGVTWKSHEWRSLLGYSPWGHKESDTTEWLHFHFQHICQFITVFVQRVWFCMKNLREEVFFVCFFLCGVGKGKWGYQGFWCSSGCQ